MKRTDAEYPPGPQLPAAFFTRRRVASRRGNPCCVWWTIPNQGTPHPVALVSPVAGFLPDELAEFGCTTGKAACMLPCADMLWIKNRAGHCSSAAGISDSAGPGPHLGGDHAGRPADLPSIYETGAHRRRPRREAWPAAAGQPAVAARLMPAGLNKEASVGCPPLSVSGPAGTAGYGTGPGCDHGRSGCGAGHEHP